MSESVFHPSDCDCCVRITVPAGAVSVIRALEDAGYPAYLVGGGLRDALLGLAPHDWDIATAARPDDMLAIFARQDIRTAATGLAHGTVTAIVNGEAVECTTYRVDGAYSDARHPDAVTFTDRIGEDLARRDFTVNALACRLPPHLRYSPADGEGSAALTFSPSAAEWMDLFGGREDLRRGILRCVGDPEKRFREDALRILRGVRFCAQLGFFVEDATRAAMKHHRDRLRQISRERIANEFIRLLSAPHPCGEALALMSEAGLWPYVTGEADTGLLSCSVPPSPSLLSKTDQLPPEPALRLAHLFAEQGGEEVRAICRNLRLSHRMTERAVAAAEEMIWPYPADDAALRRRMACSRGVAEDAISLCMVRCREPGDAAWRRVLARCGAIRARGDALTVADLAIRGTDLLELRPDLRGPALGEMLSALLTHVWEHPEDNSRQTLLRLARQSSDENNACGSVT